MMGYLAVLMLVAALVVSARVGLTAQVPAAAAQPQTAIGGAVLNPAQAQISGLVMSPAGEPIVNTVVRARDLLTGQLGATSATANAGQFSLVVNPGSYMLEIVDAGGQIVGTSSFISAAAGTAVTAATITATTGAVTAVTAGATGLLGTLGATAAKSVTYAAAAAGVAGVITPPQVVTASPSR
jgi:hypothetical protein